MADLKISALPASTTPLAGSEVLPIVQSSTTKQVSVANLTAGRAVSALSLATSAGYTFRAADNTQSELYRYVGGSNNPGVFIKVDETTNTANLFLSGSVTTSQVLNLGAAGISDVLKIGSADVTVNTGNLVIGTSGKGIDFSATSGSGTSELLADYEEGTFTPVVIGSTTAGTASYDFRIARYTKTGRMVQIEIAMQWNSGTGTGNLQISGLPFTNAANYTSLSIGRVDGLALTALNTATAYVEANASLINFRQYATGGGADSAVAYDAAALIFVAGCYSV